MALPFASRHSPTFPALLRQLGAAVLVSTYQAGQIILLRAQGTVLNTHFTALERPMGLAGQGDKLAVGAGFQVWEYRNLPAVADKLPEAQDGVWLPRWSHVTGDIDVHELAYAEDGALWLVNTRLSCLCTLDPAHSVVPRWRPPFVSAYDLTDRCHLNGLALRDGRPAYVTALGETDTPGGWRANKKSGGVLFDLKAGQILARGLSMPHSPRWHADRLWLLESGAGTLVTIHPATGAKTVIAELPGFTRGLDFAGRYAFVGLSQVRETAVFAGLPLTERVAERYCGVWVVDIATGRTLALVSFSGAVQEIFAVQILPQRYPVLLELSDPLVRSSYSLPEAALAELAPPDPLAEALDRALQQHQRGEWEAAIAGYRAVLAQQPGHFQARFQLGAALADAGRWAEAAIEFEAVAVAQPKHAEAHNSLGRCAAEQGHFDDALAHFERALAADRQFALAHVNRGLLLLLLGRYREGWAEYEWRWQLPTFTPLACPQPSWQGQAIPDKTLLVHTEQGAGDAIQFARFLPEAARRCKQLILATTAELRPLLAHVDGVAGVYLPGAIPAESFDVFCPLLSLPGVLNITLDNLPAAPYLKVPPRLSVPQLEGPGLKAGIVWAGSPTYTNDYRRSCPKEALRPLYTVPGVRWYALQTPLTKKEADWVETYGITNLAPELTDYARTAALIQQLDLIISVDTSVVHLAGALGKPVWVLLGTPPDWRWGLAREDSPWYSTARLFRQRRPGAWDEVIAQARRALEGLTAQG